MSENNKNREQPGLHGEVRKAHYGEGRQPWDTICELNWGPEFAAANVIKYLRRTKDPEHSLESARRYHARLREFTTNRAFFVLADLGLALSAAEKERLLG